MKNHFVYFLQSELDGTIYIGFTSDLELRLKQHNKGHSQYTSSKMPWRLIHSEMFPDKSSAIKREKQLKKSSWHKKQILDKILGTKK